MLPGRRDLAGLTVVTGCCSRAPTGTEFHFSSLFLRRLYIHRFLHKFTCWNRTVFFPFCVLNKFTWRDGLGCLPISYSPLLGSDRGAISVLALGAFFLDMPAVYTNASSFTDIVEQKLF